MEIKRTEKAFQISETQNSETNSASSKKVSTLSTPDSFENGNSNQPMFAAPQPENPLSKASESLEKQFNATRVEQSMIGTSSPQPISRANDKQAEFTKAHTEFKAEVDARAQEQLTQGLDRALDELRNGQSSSLSSILGNDYVPFIPDFLTHDTPGRNTPTEKPKPEPVMKFEIDEKQKFFNDLLESNRLKPTSSVQDERIKNVKDHNNVQDFYPSVEPTSRVNDKQAEFTEAKAGFEKTIEKERRNEEVMEAVTNLIADPFQALNDWLSGIDPFKEEESIPTAESNRKQKELTDLLAANREALKNS